MDCNEFAIYVQKTFGFLFTDFGFSIVFQDESDRPGYCLLGLQAKHCRIIIYTTWGEGNVWLGTTDSRFGWEHTIEGKQHWYSLKVLLDFLLRRPHKREPYTGSFPSKEEQLINHAKDLQAHAQQLLGMFEPEAFKTWQPDFTEFRQEREEEYNSWFSTPNQ